MGFRRNVRDLLSFQKERENVPGYTSPSKVRKPWSFGTLQDQEIKRLEYLSDSGTRLEELKRSNGWADLLECRNFYLRQADLKTKDISCSHDERRDAAVNYHAILGLFSEIEQRIKRGREAYKTIASRKEENKDTKT